mmetsp:Transcript_43447/g.95085  ORF Transcript_43447/g.95085 Transcript_43447/m.95085 type:complete len:317 (-) Transcript_43447:844-1794(-)
MFSGEKLMFTFGSSARKPCCQSLAPASPSEINIDAKGSLCDEAGGLPAFGSSAEAAVTPSASSLKNLAKREARGGGAASSPSSAAMADMSASNELIDHGSTSLPVGLIGMPQSRLGSSSEDGCASEKPTKESPVLPTLAGAALCALGAPTRSLSASPALERLMTPPTGGHGELGACACGAESSASAAEPRAALAIAAAALKAAGGCAFASLAHASVLAEPAAAGRETVSRACCDDAAAGYAVLPREPSAALAAASMGKACSWLSKSELDPPAAVSSCALGRTTGEEAGANVALSVRPSSATPSTARMACSASSRVA